MTIKTIDETLLNEFRPGYADIFIEHFSQKHAWTTEFTREVLRDALRFLQLCAMSPSGVEAYTMVSSPVVDKIADSILLDTPLLMWLEREVFGARLVHVPSYAHGMNESATNNLRYQFTVDLLLAAGYELDRQTIWPSRLPVDYLPCSSGNDLEDCNWGCVR